MENKHLTDDEIQDYLDGNRSLSNAAVHIALCERCRRELSRYKYLFNMLGEDPGFELDSSFSERVMSKIVYRPFLSTAEIVLLLFCLLSSVFTSFYFLGLNRVIEPLFRVLIKTTKIPGLLFSAVKGLLARADLNVSIVIYSSITLLIIFIFDHFIIRPRVQKIDRAS